jgi:hypothetical protein
MPLTAASVRTDFAKINYQPPEPWEDGFSLVFAGNPTLVDVTLLKAAELLRLELSTVEKVLNAGAPIPLSYLRSLPDAHLLASRLAQVGFECAIVGDDLLQARTPPTRVRSVIFEQNEILLEDFNTRKFSPVSCNDRVLLVTGALTKKSSDVSGKIRNGALKTTSETLAYSDEAVIDIYPPSDVYGYRVRPAGFDFSCLADRMQALGSANMMELTAELRKRFSDAVVRDEFRSAVTLIESVWPAVKSDQSNSVPRGMFGGVRKQSLTVLDNTIQFTKFSRLQRHFL